MKLHWSRAVLALSAGLAFAAVAPRAVAQTVTNPSFETPDPAVPTVKPQGWYRQTYNVNRLPTFQNHNQVIDPWVYITNGTPGGTTHTGTHSVAVAGGPALFADTIYSWEPEGSVAGEAAAFESNTDNRGAGPLAAVVPNGLYRISAWFKRTGGNGTGQLRYTFNSTDHVAGFGGGARLTAPSGPTDWIQLTADITAENNFLALKAYNQALDATTIQYWDDFSVQLLALPQTFTGTVTDQNGAPVAGAAVGVRPVGSNGLDAPQGYAVTNAQGQYTMKFAKPAGDFVAQAWLVPADNTQNVLAGPSVPLLAEGTPTNLTVDTSKNLVDVLAGKPIVAVSSKEYNGNFWPLAVNDNDTGSRWSTRGPDQPKMPHYIVFDLGAPVTFPGGVKQIEAWFENARPGHYQLRVSNTPPDPAMYQPVNNGNNQLALSYGTVVYDSPQGMSSFYLKHPSRGDTWINVLNTFKPGTGRYLMVLMDAAGPFGNFSIYEMKVQALPSTVTGKVVDAGGAGVANARVMVSSDGAAIATTDASGNYTATLGQDIPTPLWAHMPTADGNEVYPDAGPVTVTPSGSTATAPNLILPAAVPNLVPATAAADAYLNSDPGTDYNSLDPTGATDNSFLTQWATNNIPNPQGPAPEYNQVIARNNPFYFVVDLGAQKTFDETLIYWGVDWPFAYRIETATTYDMLGRTGGDWKTVLTRDVWRPAYAATEIGDYNADIATFPQTTARYVRIAMVEGPDPALYEMLELQVANVPLPVPPLGLASRALKVAGGLEGVTSAADFAALNAAGGTTIDLLDVIALAKQGK